jgi:hypothetical protein
MIIPVGLIFSLIRMLVRALSNRPTAAMELEARRYDGIHDQYAERLARRGQELWRACTGPDAGTIVLSGIDWRSCAINGVPLTAAVTEAAPVSSALPARASAPVSAQTSYAPYRPTGGGSGQQALVGVAPGLHQVTAWVNDRRVDLLLSVHPREARAIQFDAAGQQWHELHGAEQAHQVAEGLTQPVFNYNANVCPLLMQNTSIQMSGDALASSLHWLNQAQAAKANGMFARSQELVANAQSALIGVPIASFAKLTDGLGFQAFELKQAGKPQEATALIQLGLAVLPDSPTLLAVLGELQLAAGDPNGRISISQALKRESYIPEAMRVRAQSLAAA